MITDRKSLNVLLAAFTHQKLDSGMQLFKTLSAGGYTLAEFEEWLSVNSTFNVVDSGEDLRAAFLLNRKSVRESHKSNPKNPCSPCSGKGNKVQV